MTIWNLAIPEGFIKAGGDQYCGGLKKDLDVNLGEVLFQINYLLYFLLKKATWINLNFPILGTLPHLTTTHYD